MRANHRQRRRVFRWTFGAYGNIQLALKLGPRKTIGAHKPYGVPTLLGLQHLGKPSAHLRNWSDCDRPDFQP